MIERLGRGLRVLAQLIIMVGGDRRKAAKQNSRRRMTQGRQRNETESVRDPRRGSRTSVPQSCW